MTNAKKMGTAEIRAIAVEAQCDPRTVRKMLAGEKVQPMTRERIATSLRSRSIRVPVKP